MAEEFAGGGVDDADVEVVDEHEHGCAGVGAADADVVHAAGAAEGDGAGLVDAVVADAVVGAGAGAVGAGLGEEVVDDGGGPVEGAVWPVVVVDLDEVVEEGLESARCGGRLGGEPRLRVCWNVRFPAGGRVVGSGVLLGDAEGGQGGLEVVAAAAVAGEAGGVDEGVVGQDRYGKPCSAAASRKVSTTMGPVTWRWAVTRRA